MKDFLKAGIHYFFCSHRQFRSTILTDSSSLYSLSPPSVPPAPPTLYVQGSSRDALTLRWSLRPHHALVRGYILNYKREYGNWEEVRFHTLVSCCLASEEVPPGVCLQFALFYVHIFSSLLFYVGGSVIPGLFTFAAVALRQELGPWVRLHFCCTFVGGGVSVFVYSFCCLR